MGLGSCHCHCHCRYYGKKNEFVGFRKARKKGRKERERDRQRERECVCVCVRGGVQSSRVESSRWKKVHLSVKGLTRWEFTNYYRCCCCYLAGKKKQKKNKKKTKKKTAAREIYLYRPTDGRPYPSSECLVLFES